MHAILFENVEKPHLFFVEKPQYLFFNHGGLADNYTCISYFKNIDWIDCVALNQESVNYTHSLFFLFFFFP